MAVFWTAPLSIATMSTWGIFQQKHIMIDDNGIQQPSIISGSIAIKWSDVTKLEKEGYGRIRIYSFKKRIVISSYLFNDPEQLIKFIVEKVQNKNSINIEDESKRA